LPNETTGVLMGLEFTTEGLQVKFYPPQDPTNFWNLLIFQLVAQNYTTFKSDDMSLYFM